MFSFLLKMLFLVSLLSDGWILSILQTKYSAYDYMKRNSYACIAYSKKDDDDKELGYSCMTTPISFLK